MSPNDLLPSRPKPTKKRRRWWLIVSFVLVFMPTILWWFWPRGDARFVGKWAALRDGVRAPGYFLFRSNGTGANVDPATQYVCDWSWKVEDNEMRFRPPVGLPESTFLNYLSHQSSKYFDRYFLTYEQRLEVLSVTEDRIVTRLAGSGNNLELRRIRE